MDQLYRQQIIENYRNPKNTGKPDKFTHTAKAVNTSCGDEIEVFLDVNDGKIVDLKYDARGCAISIASISLVSEDLKGKHLTEVTKLDENYILEILGTDLTGTRIKCGTLGLEAINKAITI